MRSTFKHSLIAGASALLMSLSATTAMAQEDGTDTPEASEDRVLQSVVVTGFRNSLAQALDVKREASGVVDAIVAEDIAAFPDLNLAESIQRIPGISINRVAGEGRQITVRGLGSTFTRVRINGMEALSTTGGSDASGGTNRGRAFDFNTFASDLFNEIRVTKTTSAHMDEGSLGATVDLNTARPFDYDAGFTAAASAQAGLNSVSEEFSPRLAGLLSWTNDQDNFGVLVSAAFSDRTIIEEGFSSVRWQDADFRSVNGAACPAGTDCATVDTNSLVYHPRIPRYGRLTNEQERLGLTGSVQFRPSSSTTVSIDGLFSQLDATREENFLEVFFRGQEGSIDVTDFTVNANNNTIDTGTFTISPNANGTHPIRSEGRFDELKTEFTQLTLDVEHEFSDRLRGNVIAGMVESEFANPVQTTIFFDAVGDVTDYSYDFTQNANAAAIDFGSLNVTDPTQFALTEFRDRPNSVNNKFETISGTLEYDLNDTVVLSGGLNYKTFEFATEGARRESTFGSIVCSLPGQTCPVGATGLALTPAITNTLSGFGNDLDAPGGIDRAWLVPNVSAVRDLLNISDIEPTLRPGDNRGVKEEDLGIFVQADFETTWGGVPVRGDVGVRYVETKVDSSGVVVDGNGDATTVSVDRSYQDTLPSLNLAFEVTEDVIVRTSVAKVMSRPALGNLNPGGSLDSFNTGDYRYSSGNPALDPFRATAYDVSVEWYFNEEALLAASAFYKDVDNFFLDSESEAVPYSQTGLPASLPPASSPLFNDLAAGGDPLVTVSQKTNGGPGSIQGFELSYQQPFSFLPGLLGNTGFQGNYTYVDSDDILGFSPNAFNATVYYEDDRFSARLSGAYRDAYLTRAARTSGSAIGRDERGVTDSFNLDFASSYKVNEQVDVTFEAINLTDEYEQQVYDAADLINVYHHTGTEFLVGARFKF